MADDFKSPEERRAEEAECERAEYEESAGGRMKLDEPDQRAGDLDLGLVKVLEGQTYDPTEHMDLGGTTGEVVQDLSKPLGVDAANAIAESLSGGQAAGGVVVGQRTLEVPEPPEG